MDPSQSTTTQRSSIIATPGGTVTRIPPALQARMAAQLARSANNSTPSFHSLNGSSPTHPPMPPSLRSRMPNGVGPGRPPPDINGATNAMSQTSINGSPSSHPVPPALSGLAARRAAIASSQGRTKPKMSLNQILPQGDPALPPVGGGAAAAGLRLGRPDFNDANGRRPPPASTPFANFNKIVDPSGALRFTGKAVLHASGVDFSNGSSFAINMSEFELEEELGRGNYGTVKKVFHKPTKVIMAMKEIRLELDQSKLNSILVELEILHRASASEIVEFYGAFFVESCVYYCMEYMDAGSLDTLIGHPDESAAVAAGPEGDEPPAPTEPSGSDFVQDDRQPGGPAVGGLPEDVMARITGSMVRGLKFLKDELNVMHRDVKPTNVLVNKKGQVKLCDFGVSGQLEKSLAKTNIGCQSYMAPERIHGEAQNKQGTYSVSSDVWSLGLSIIELGMGKYPYPPEMYSNVFAQLTAIVHGPSPRMPMGYSDTASDFVDRCLMKEPAQRGTYAQLLEHPWLKEDSTRQVDMVAWVTRAVVLRERAKKSGSTISNGNGNHD
ncbi:hypothetical protein FRB96_000882 [Tulasnella sp. 330]|nr:hypothetical protein FRB96_000882 [Tulasnella sp. 330]KAG8882708.1 hypothetical protein FRB97_007848 [Tulasnella sp. 331]KAG8888228.1 hypothetical protein FRB98_008168 [Tulasnella sp. 332]